MNFVSFLFSRPLCTIKSKIVEQPKWWKCSLCELVGFVGSACKSDSISWAHLIFTKIQHNLRALCYVTKYACVMTKMVRLFPIYVQPFFPCKTFSLNILTSIYIFIETIVFPKASLCDDDGMHFVSRVMHKLNKTSICLCINLNIK